MSNLLRMLSSAAQSRVQKALMSGRFDDLWPALKVISCWMDGPSEEFTKQLSGRFSGCRFSPKGLLATEGVVSISWGLSGLCPLAIDSHVLEFLDENDKRHLAHELVCGERYRPLISTAGGLYRYDLGDWLEVTAFMHNTPCVRFVGRGDTRSDLVGEKLDDDIVAKALQVIASRDLAAFLVPVVDGENARYRLVLQNVDHSDEDGIASLVEAELMRVVHYAQARKLAQLAPLDVVSTNDCGTLLQRAWEATGRRAGDLKPAHLVVSPEMARAIIELTNGQSKEQTI